jgi:hypothetical protein
MAFPAYLSQPFQILTEAFDPDTYPGVGLSINWEQIDGPGEASFDDVHSLTPTVVCDIVGLYTFRVTVSDSVTPASVLVLVQVYPLFNATAAATAYCPVGSTGTPVTITGLGSSNLSAADATAKALNAAGIAAEASLACAPYLELPPIQINIFGTTQIDSTINAIQLSYLSAGTLAVPLQETVLQTLIGFSEVKHPISLANSTIADPGNLLFPYSTVLLSDIMSLLLPLSGPINLILRAGDANTGNFNFPIPLNLDEGPEGVSIQSLSASANVLPAPNAVISLPNNNPGEVYVSLKKGRFLGFDTSNWRSAGSPATHLLLAIPQGSLHQPTGLATVTTIPMGRPGVPPLVEVVRIDTFLTLKQRSEPLYLAFFAATYTPGPVNPDTGETGVGVYTPIANSIQFDADSVFTASDSAPPGAGTPVSILSLSGSVGLNIPSASNGVLYFPDMSYVRVVAGMSDVP